MKTPLTVHPDVAEALSKGRAVVGLETTILAFGLPKPANSEVGKACESTAREFGALPATTAILEGSVHVGLDAAQLELFCSQDPGIRKVNLQNFAAVLAQGIPGALTAGASMQACALAGIRVFATGGIGGVHRGYARTPDISSDLRALAEFPVAVVCAGAKSILDIPATLEVLETLGVPVVGYRASTFPLFYAASSQIQLEDTFDDVGRLARFVNVHLGLGRGGVLVVTPVPEEQALGREELDEWTARALEDAARAHVYGKKVTPFLLQRLEELSHGKTLGANRALILNNVRLAAQLAARL